MKKVILQGFLAEEFGRDWEIKANSYAEIFSCIDANYPEFRPRLIEYYQQGGDISIQTGEELLKEVDIEDLLNPLEFDTIYITPVPTGSKSGGAKILAGIALIGLLFVPGGAAVAGALINTIGWGATASLALGMAMVGINLAMTGLQQLLAPDPSVDDENEQDYLFNGPQDVVASGNPVPVLVGEMIIGGIVMSAGVIPGLPGAAGHIGGYPAGSGGFIDLAGGLSGGAGGSVDEFLWDNSYLLSGALDEPQKDYILYSENTITKPWTARSIPTGVSYISPVTPHDIPNNLWAAHNASVNLYQHSPDIDWSNFQDEIVGSIPTQATLFRTLSGPTINAEVDFGSNSVSASLNATLENIILESEISLDSELILNANLDDISFSSVGSFTGLSEIAASLEATLDNISFTATSSADFIAILNGTLDPIGLSGEATNEFIASLVSNLEEVAFASTATVGGASSRTTPVYRSSSGSTGSYTVSRPSGVVQDDLLIGIFADFATGNNITIPSGWTDISGALNGPFDLHSRVAYKIAGSSEPTSYTFSSSTLDYPCSVLLAFSSVDTASPIANSTNSSGGGSAPSLSSVTVANNNSAVAALITGYNTSRSAPSGMTGRLQQFTTSGYSIEGVSSGSYGPATFSTAEDTWAGILVAINGAQVTAPPAIPVYNSSSTAVDNTTISTPSGVVDGDLLVGTFIGYDSDTASINLPSGWTALGSVQRKTGTDAIFAQVAYKVANSEPSSYTFSLTAGIYPSAVITRYSDTHPLIPIDNLVSTNGSTSLRTVPETVSDDDNAKLAVVSIGYHYGPTNGNKGDLTQRAFFDSVSAWYDTDIATAGSTGTGRTINQFNASSWLNLAFVINGEPN